MRGDVGGRFRLSILDHTPVSSGSTLGEAFWYSTRLAELAEHSRVASQFWLVLNLR